MRAMKIEKEDRPDGGKSVVVNDERDALYLGALRRVLDAQTLVDARNIAFDAIVEGESISSSP